MEQEEKILRDACGIPETVEINPLAIINFADAIEALRQAKIIYSKTLVSDNEVNQPDRQALERLEKVWGDDKDGKYKELYQHHKNKKDGEVAIAFAKTMGYNYEYLGENKWRMKDNDDTPIIDVRQYSTEELYEIFKKEGGLLNII